MPRSRLAASLRHDAAIVPTPTPSAAARSRSIGTGSPGPAGRFLTSAARRWPSLPALRAWLAALGAALVLAASHLPAVAAAGAGSEIPVAGRIVGPRGTPMAEAEVLLLPSLNPVQEARLADAGELPKPASRAVTDAGGNFRLSAPHAGLWTVRAQVAGFVPLEFTLEPLLEPLDLPDAELAADAGLTVKVTDTSGAPLAGARVRLAPPEMRGLASQPAGWHAAKRTALADAQGSARLPRSEKEPSVLTACASGFLPQERRNVRGTAAAFKLQPGLPRTLKVLSSDGAPAAGVLALATDLSVPLGFSDDKGLLRLGVPPGADLSLTLIAEDGRRVRGFVSSAEEQPGAASARAGEPTRRAKPAGGTAPEGSTLSAPGGGAPGQDGPLDSHPGQDGARDIRHPAAPGGSARAAEAGRSGTPAAQEGSAPAAGAAAGAGAGDAGAGSGATSAAEAGAAAASARQGSASGALRLFTLPAQLVVKGRVLDARTRAAVAGGLVWFDGDLWGAAVTDAAGGYALSAANGRGLEILAGAPGYLRPDAFPYAVDRVGGPGPTLALQPAAAIEGIVVDESGRPVAGAETSLEVKRGGERMMIIMGRETPAPRAVTSARGSFRLSPVDPANNYTLKAAARGFAPQAKEILGLEPRRTMGGIRVEMNRGHAVGGLVLDGQGQPVGEAEAVLRPARPARRGPNGLGFLDSSGPSKAPYKATTDKEGRFRIAGVGSGSFDLELKRAGFATKSVPAVEVPARPEPVDVGTIVLEPGLRIQGLASAPDGSPLEGVEISLGASAPGPMMMMGRPSNQPPAAVTDANGRFAIEDLRAGEPVNLAFSRTGFVPARESGIELPRTDPVLVTLQPASKVSGRIVGPDKKPVPSAEVNLTRSTSGGIGNESFKMMMREGASADDDGRFQFDNVKPGQISLSAVASGWQEAKLDGVDVPQGKDVEGLELALRPGAVVVGRVLSPDGRPVAGARVAPVSDDPEPLRIGGPLSDGDGVYRLEGLAPGKLSIEAAHDDYVRTVKEIDLRAGANKLDLQFAGGQDVSGLVSDANGAPLAGAFVQLSAAGRGWGGPETKTDADGAFKLAGVGDGDYALNASREGYAPSLGEVAVHVAGKPAAGITVSLSAGGRIAGIVTGLDPERLPQVDIRASGAAGRDATGTVDRQGRFKLENLAAGTWTVAASLASTGQQARGEVVLEKDAAEATLELQFGKGLTLSGRALQGDAPVKGAVLFAQGNDVNHSAWGRTGSDGTFRMEGLEAGTYTLELRVWETGLSHDETVALATSREVTLRVPTARIIGRIVDGAERRPVAGASLALARPGGEEQAGGPGGGASGGGLMMRGATSDLNGRFELTNVTDGTWTVTANKTGYAAATAEVSVHSGHDVDDLRLALDATEGLTLDVTLPSGRAPDTVDVAVLDAAGHALTGGSYATGENGRVRLGSVPAGSWEIVVSAGGSGALSLRANVPGQPVAVHLPPACALKVTVPALAGSTTAATATIKGVDGRIFRALGWMSDTTSQFRLAGGQLQIDTLPPGSWTVQVAAADGRSWSATSSTQPGTRAEVVLQ